MKHKCLLSPPPRGGQGWPRRAGGGRRSIGAKRPRFQRALIVSPVSWVLRRFAPKRTTLSPAPAGAPLPPKRGEGKANAFAGTFPSTFNRTQSAAAFGKIQNGPNSPLSDSCLEQIDLMMPLYSCRHCEKRSDGAIHEAVWFATAPRASQ
jgi:hypothetical protein